MLCRQGLYLIVRKVFSLVYELDIPPDSCIHSVMSIVYLIRYRLYEDIFGRTFLFPRPVEARTDTDTSGNVGELRGLIDFLCEDCSFWWSYGVPGHQVGVAGPCWSGAVHVPAVAAANPWCGVAAQALR